MWPAPRLTINHIQGTVHWKKERMHPCFRRARPSRPHALPLQGGKTDSQTLQKGQKR